MQSHKPPSITECKKVISRRRKKTKPNIPICHALFKSSLFKLKPKKSPRFRNINLDDTKTFQLSPLDEGVQYMYPGMTHY